MLRLPLLKDMTPVDLCQRYGESWIKYNNEPVFCRGFSVGDDRKIRIGLTDKEPQVFNWELLDTSRPASRWYIMPNSKTACYFALTVEKQYSRGVTENNSWLFMPDAKKYPSMRILASVLFDEENQNLDWKQRITMEELVHQVSENGTVMLSPFLIVMPNGHIYYRTMKVGFLESKKNIRITKRFILEELQDCCRNANFTHGV